MGIFSFITGDKSDGRLTSKDVEVGKFLVENLSELSLKAGETILGFASAVITPNNITNIVNFFILITFFLFLKPQHTNQIL